ncbi:MAG: leucyl/phenylalanyl-tRNA--protein transferase, partial [Burkholderiales bacterium]
MLTWVDPGRPLPPPSKALSDPNGLLAAGRDLSPERLLEAYGRGIFPWYSAGQPVLWWSP